MMPINLDLYNKRSNPFKVIYFLLLNDVEIYIGITSVSVKRRIRQHKKGKGSKHTKGKKIILLKIIPTNIKDHSTAAKLENRAVKLTEKILKNYTIWGGCNY